MAIVAGNHFDLVANPLNYPSDMASKHSYCAWTRRASVTVMSPVGRSSRRDTCPPRAMFD